MTDTYSDRNVNAALERAEKHSPFLRVALAGHPEIAAASRSGRIGDAIRAVRNKAGDVPELSTALRQQRSALALALAIGDLAGLLPLERLVRELSDFADDAIERALDAAIRARTPEADPKGFAVIALGKHGSRELNYSSDVDLLFLFDPATLPLKPREEPQQAAVRIGQRIVELIQKRDADGYVFRIDLRLRPSPEVTPIALPVEAAISYYESSALPWERAAFIRARTVAGDKALGSYFLEAIHPFVWRRSIDFGAIGELQSITRRIRDHYAQGQSFGPGFDLKRGRGGIREIEFFAQMHQLIHGGREPRLRAPATLDALAALAADGRIAEADAVFWAPLTGSCARSSTGSRWSTTSRPTACRQTARPSTMSRGSTAFPDGGALLELLEPAVSRVAGIYGGLAQDEEERLPHDAQALEGRLEVPASRIQVRGASGSRAGAPAMPVRSAPRPRGRRSRRCCLR